MATAAGQIEEGGVRAKSLQACCELATRLQGAQAANGSLLHTRAKPHGAAVPRAALSRRAVLSHGLLVCLRILRLRACVFVTFSLQLLRGSA